MLNQDKLVWLLFYRILYLYSLVWFIFNLFSTGHLYYYEEEDIDSEDLPFWDHPDARPVPLLPPEKPPIKPQKIRLTFAECSSWVRRIYRYNVRVGIFRYFIYPRFLGDVDVEVFGEFLILEVLSNRVSLNHILGIIRITLTSPYDSIRECLKSVHIPKKYKIFPNSKIRVTKNM